ncbi:MAG: hypothetical protein KIT00_02620 [Rhodospirillales bacterium]|nr:hypothetical protein [Rhodospirillales bacterium]
MNAKFHHPTDQEMQAYMRRTSRERSKVVANAIDRLLSLFSAHSSKAHDGRQTQVLAGVDRHSHRLAA